ncbi:MAG: polyribonucleotide nucleotidyltransferase [Sphingomonadales bacterium]|jgi:polyribonucleotide nucleotidyltransferase|nr:polyribonucleotide nucleotidyltransferase [Sphingomonadales bacterium]MBK9003451.1 polyribonucleotide nucleotidyltransferase [Sphingomonadales bacterium]MBK9268567.1 polyribonucleotide nucleotidyltransferase [Sphingomonadales bacterium]
MFDVKNVSIEWGGQTLTLETGKVARQADGAVIATLGETVVLCAVTAAKSVKEGQDFFPLTVHYQEKYSSAGRIPGGFFKRERGATEKETLVSRLIDRPVRPLFPEGFYNEINAIAQVLSYDGENEPDILAMIAASAALTISGVPFMGPIGAARVGYQNGEYILNPTDDQVAEGDLDLVVAATYDAVMMVESEANELSEEVMLGAVMFAHDACREVIKAIVKLAEQAAKEPWELNVGEDNAALKDKLKKLIGKDIDAAYKLTNKSERSNALNAARDKAKAMFAEDGLSPQEVMAGIKLTKKLEAEIVRTAILKTGQRIDGRTTTQIRPIVAETHFLPRAHGSALFTRGETQTIATCTLGTKDAEQMIDGLNGLHYEHFMLHYNFPPYSVGEVGRFGAPGRREVGHGKLAWRALHPVLPTKDEFPYTIRLTSDITESNGSSSMASVCGGSLAMMDAGVPIKRPVSGIAMGLILEGKDYSILSDILGDEDHLGDMDFKVGGTEIGITTMQMDIKIAGITREIFEAALNQAKEGRAHILGEMNKALGATRTELSAHAPRIETMQIDKSKIRDIIGTGGKVIREIVATTGAKVDIDDEGLIKISSSDLSQIEAARKWISGIVEEAEVGKIYDGKVVNIVDFGAFVNFMGGKDGLVHVSEMKNERVEKPTDVVSEGMDVKVKVLEIDPRGKVRLSMRLVDQETGEELEDTRPPREPRERSDRGDRGDRGPRRDRGGRDDRGGRGRDRGDRGPRRERSEGGEGGDPNHVPDFLKD